MESQDSRLKTNFFVSIFYNLLIKFYWFRKTKLTYKIWRLLWDLMASKKCYVKTEVHGYPAILPAGHWYLLVNKVYPKFNQPLISLLKYCQEEEKKSVNIVDVGSAVGDTVLLLESISPGRNNFLCIDGDIEYINLSFINLKFIRSRVRFIHSLISDNFEDIPKVFKINPTTGSSISDELAQPNTLDQILEAENKIDLVKIDIDGFDGKAIGGMKKIISKFRPKIIFEWNVPQYISTKNDIYQPFIDLYELGYRNLYWFDNFGNFLFYLNVFDKDIIKKMASYSILNEEKSGFHFDIIAIKEDSDFIKFVI